MNLLMLYLGQSHATQKQQKHNEVEEWRVWMECLTNREKHGKYKKKIYAYFELKKHFPLIFNKAMSIQCETSIYVKKYMD